MRAPRLEIVCAQCGDVVAIVNVSAATQLAADTIAALAVPQYAQNLVIKHLNADTVAAMLAKFTRTALCVHCAEVNNAGGNNAEQEEIFGRKEAGNGGHADQEGKNARGNAG